MNAIARYSATANAQPVSIVVDVNAPDCHSLDQGLVIGAQGPAHGYSQRKEDRDRGERFPALVDFPFDGRHDGGSWPLGLLVQVVWRPAVD